MPPLDKDTPKCYNISDYYERKAFKMKAKKKILSGLLCASIILLSACSSGENGGSVNEANVPASTTTTQALDNEIDYGSMADIGEVDEANEDGVGPAYVKGQLAGEVRALCYYDIADQEKETAQLFAERFGGTLTTEKASWSEWWDKLGTYIATGNSPDLVRYDWIAFPCYASKNTYTPLDDWLDMDADLWSDIKSVIQSFDYAGKHFYFPSDVMPGFTITYNRASVLEAGLKDPLELYRENNWNWNTFKELAAQWVDKDPENNEGLRGNKWMGLMFTNTTGVKMLDVTGTDIVNNLRNENVERAMSFLSDMRKQGLIGDGYVDPGSAFADGSLLFLAMESEWTFESAQQGLFNNGLEGEIVTIPMPKDPNSDKYYIAADTFGYMVPAGASNVQGGVDWILANRIYESDPETKAADLAYKTSTDPVYYDLCPGCRYDFTANDNSLTVCPECDTARKEKFKAVYSKEQYDLIDEMIHSDKFELVFDNAMGIDGGITDIMTATDEALIDGVTFHDASYTSVLNSKYEAIEAFIQPYRDALAKAAQ